MGRIRQEKLKVSPKSKLVSFLQSLRVHKLDPPAISAAKLRSWYEENKGVPIEENKPSAIDFDVRAGSYNVKEQH